ncbi:hypothetical protein TNCV_653421 [Trichonephila clavipes]|nr:hypothetical protein TNCV_653421 [Trichonephila clavipes]
MQVTVQFSGEHPGGWSGASHFPSPAANLTRRLVARRLFRVPPCHEGTMHLQTSMSSPVFEPRPYGTAISVVNHYTGKATLFLAVSVERVANQRLHLRRDEASDWLDARR